MAIRLLRRACSTPSQTVKPMSRMRQTIAKRMLESRQNTATLTSFTEIDLSNLLAVRREHGPAFQERHGGVKLGMMSFFVKACSEAPGVPPSERQITAKNR